MILLKNTPQKGGGNLSNPLLFGLTMDARFYIDYQTIDQTKRMMVKAPDDDTAQARAEAYLKERYGEVFTILSIEQLPGEELWEQIAEYVMLGNSHRHDCETEAEAKDLAARIEDVFKRHRLADSFGALNYRKAVHVFPIYWVMKGSIHWKELNEEREQDLGWYGRNR